MNAAHETSGARDLPMGQNPAVRSSTQAVSEFDFSHVSAEAARVQLDLWGARELDDAAVEVASAVHSAASRFLVWVSAGAFTDVQLYELRHVPHALGRVLASIDPERAQ